jgi:hypothetical protein
MPVIGTQLKEIHAERRIPKGKEFRVDIRPDVKNVREERVLLERRRKLLVFEFEFTANYTSEKEKFGEVRIVVEVRYVNKEAKMRKIIQTWKKERRIEPEVMNEITGIAFEVAKIEAIYIARKVLLPSPIPLLKIKLREKPGYIG